MKHIPILIALVLSTPCQSPAAGTHLDIMVPDIKDTDLIGPVKSVEVQLWQNVSGEYTTEKREFDRTGNLVKITEWDEEDEVVDTTEFLYDETGCYERMHYENKDKGLSEDWQVILNPETRQIALREATLGRIAMESYTESGYRKEYKLLDSDKRQLLAYKYERDEQNRKTRYIRYQGTHPQYTYYFKWADNGFIDMEHQIYHAEKEQRRHTYEYLVNDDHGNWTQRIMVRYDVGGKKPVKVYEHTVVRKIEYFGEDEPDTVDSPEEPDGNGSEGPAPTNTVATADSSNDQAATLSSNSGEASE